MSRLERVDRDRFGWWLIAVVMGLLVLFVLYSFIGTFVFGIFVYYATRPIYRRVKRVIHQRSLAAGVSSITSVLPAL
jgi:predicted PurR-regulated permease PerM